MGGELAQVGEKRTARGKQTTRKTKDKDVGQRIILRWTLVR
jgi:hypothetical protein